MSRARTLYVIEARDGDYLASNDDSELRFTAHPYLRSKATYTIDELTRWVSFGEGRDQPCGPSETFAFLRAIGLPAREKTW